MVRSQEPTGVFSARYNNNYCSSSQMHAVNNVILPLIMNILHIMQQIIEATDLLVWYKAEWTNIILAQQYEM